MFYSFDWRAGISQSRSVHHCLWRFITRSVVPVWTVRPFIRHSACIENSISGMRVALSSLVPYSLVLPFLVGSYNHCHMGLVCLSFVHHFSTIVIRPSRIAIVIGLLLLMLGLNFSLYMEWITDVNYPTYEEEGFILQFLKMIDPSYAAFRTLGVLYYVIQMNGVFTWSDFGATVPSRTYRDVFDRPGFEWVIWVRSRMSYNVGCFLVSYVFFYYCAWYYSYRSMCHKKCCFYLTKSFWFPKNVAKVE